MLAATTKLLLGSAFVATAAAQHSDPFAGSGCNCTAFGENECAINATAPTNLTLYRMTPFGVLDLAEKNSADMPGDVSFVISRRTAAYECKVNPTSWGCSTMVQFEGDDPNSTDLVLQMTVEVDGQWGPYLYCNDVNVSNPTGQWKCTTSLTGGVIPNYPPVCKADNYSASSGSCFKGIPLKTQTVAGLGDCCDLANSHHAHYWSMHNDTKECKVYDFAYGFESCNSSISGYYDPPRNTCNNSRVHKTVGLENLTTAFGGHSRSYHVADGLWLSHPHAGECKDGHYVGDGSGCTWRHVATTSAINASCMYERIDAAIEASDPSCFGQCQPNNKTTDCYNKCYSEASLSMTSAQLTAPWVSALSRTGGGCPQVNVSTHNSRGARKYMW